jgi:hypothetical protein
MLALARIIGDEVGQKRSTLGKTSWGSERSGDGVQRACPLAPALGRREAR